MATFKGFATRAVHSGQEPDKISGAVIPSISVSTTFAQKAPGVYTDKYDYSRAGNPTRTSFEEAVAALEDGKYGLAFSSGSAVTVVITYLFAAGDHIISINDVYGGTNRFFNKVALPVGIQNTFIDLSDLTNLEKAVKPNTKMLWIESPTNPTLRVTDIQAVSDMLKKKLNRPDIILVVDNTFMSPYCQQPLHLGADIVVHSVTKYLNGHSDTVMGVLVCNDEKLKDRLAFLQNAIGATPSPFDCFLANRGLKTLPLRMQKHQENAMQIAKYLQNSKYVDEVLYPGLESHPSHAIAKKQQKGFGGMISVRIKGNIENAKTFFQHTKIFVLAESLGGVESLAEIPSLMTHAGVSEEERKELGISDTLIRLSVGIEDVEDLIEDLEFALSKSYENEQTSKKQKKK